MVQLSLKVRLAEADITKTIQLNSGLLVYDACKLIRDRFSDGVHLGKPSDYGLFLSDEDIRKGRWLDPNRTLEFYMLRNGDTLDYKRKIRQLRVRMLDNSVKTLMVDESQTLKNLLPIICAKIGLTSYDEYDLVREFPNQENGENGYGTVRRGQETGTLRKGTLSRDRDQKKMEKLKQKLATDDDVTWVDQSRTLLQQGVSETDVLLLKRRYFYSDQNVDARDPVQCNLLYVQCRDAILSGTHPVTYEQAVQFAGLQAQAEYGDFDETRRAIDMRPFLPKSYAKTKGAEKRVYDEWMPTRGFNDIQAKMEYIKRARKLPTYGVTFFLVREKLKGKNKLVPRLFGVTKNSCMRLDEKTKEILTTWPLTQVKRWAASPNTFTLDFGDYADEYYSVETQEGEQIAQLIAGYIDIILKRQKPKDHFGIGGEEGCTLEEDEVVPSKINIIQPRETKVEQIERGQIAMPGIIRDINAEKPIKAIEAAKAKVVEIVQNLEKPVVLPPVGDDPVSKRWVEEKVELHKQNIGTQMAQITKHVAEIINLTAPPVQERDHVAVDRAVNTIAANLDDVVDGIKMIAALTDPKKGDELYDATQKLCKAVRDLLDAAKPEAVPRQEMLTAVTEVGEAAKEIMDQVDPIPIDYQDGIINAAKQVANATAVLVRKSKLVASDTQDSAQQNKIIAAATQTALSTSELVATAKVLLPTITSPESQEQLTDAARRVAKAMRDLLDQCQISGAEKPLLEDLNDAARKVTKALEDLLGNVKQGPQVSQQPVPHTATVEVINKTTSELVAAPEPAEMIKQAKVLAHATAELIKGLKSEAESVNDKDLQRRLIEASKQLAEATSRLVEAAKLCAASPQDQARHQAMREAAVNIRDLAVQTASEDDRRNALKRLEGAVKRVASASTQTISASQGASESNINPGSQGNLIEHCRIVADRLSKLINAWKEVSNNPNSQPAINGLIRNCEDFIYPADELVNASKAAVPTVQDPSAANRLRESSGNLSQALGELRTSLNVIVEITPPQNAVVNVDEAMSSISEIEKELDAFKRAAQSGTLRPLPGETLPSAGSRLQQSAKQVSSATVQLLEASAANDEGFIAEASQNVARSLQDLSAAARGVAASVPEDRQTQMSMLDSVHEVVEKSAHLVDIVRDAFGKPQDDNTQNRLVDAAREVANALNRCLNCLPEQKSISRAIKSVEETSQILSTYRTEINVQVRQGFSPVEFHLQLGEAAARLNDAATDVVTQTYGSSQQLGNSSESYSNAYRQFVDSGIQITTIETEITRRQEIIRQLQDVSSASTRLLILAKQTNGSPQAQSNPNVRSQLNDAARAVTESINNLLTFTAGSLPGQKECDNAIRRIQMLRGLLENCTVPVNNRTYYESLDAVLDSSRMLGDGMTGISQTARYNQPDQFIQAVRTTSEAVQALIENAAQAAYLLGISDPSSQVGRSGVIDHRAVEDCVTEIKRECQVIRNQSSNQQAILRSATVIAKNSHALCNMNKEASYRCSNPVAKQEFVRSAKLIASNTADLVRAVKALDNQYSDDVRQDCIRLSNNLVESVERLRDYAGSPEFSGTAGQMSTLGRKAQEPITVSGRCIIDASSSLILAAKSLAVNPQDRDAWQALTSQSTNVSDAIKSLATALRDKAPGQRECEEAIDRINNYLRVVDKASLAATGQNLPQRNDNTTEGFFELTINTTTQLMHTVTSVRDAAKAEAEALGHRMSNMTSYLQPLVNDGIGATSRSSSSKDQMTILSYLKTALEATLQFVEVCKACGGNPRTYNLHGDLQEASDALLEALNELLQVLEKVQSESGFVRTMINNVSNAISKVDQRITVTEDSYVEYQTRMFRTTKEITRITVDMNTKADSNPQDLGNLAQQLYTNYNQLAEDSRGAQGSASSDDVAQRIRASVQDLGHACIDLIKSAGSVQSNPSDTYLKDELSRASKYVTERVANVLSALQSGSSGTQACINAASTVSGVIGDLDTTIMFATAGTLQPENDTDRFVDHREDILRTAKALVEDTKTLVAGAASTQEQLASAAQNAVRTIMQLAEVAKSGAASLGKENSESQVMLVNAVRDVASALGDLIHATKAASGKMPNDPAMHYLKDSAKNMVTNIASLIKTVKNVEDEHTRGVSAMESAMEAINQELRAFETGANDGRSATAEELERATKPVTEATRKAVTAGRTKKQDDAMTAANTGRKAITELLATCRAAANSIESADARNQVLNAGRDCALRYRELLHTVYLILTRPEAGAMQQNLVQMTQNIASAVALIAAAAENMKSADSFINPDDPIVIAESELMGAAMTIEHSAKRLSQVKPRNVQYRVENEMVNFDEIILDTCQQVMAAAAALVKSTINCQAELVSTGVVDARPLHSSEDGQWSDGLIMAARSVAAACHNLCEAANAMVQGHATEEKLMSSARQVSSFTAQLIVACNVRSDPNSPNLHRLRGAGNAVIRATDNLIKAAQQCQDAYEERTLIINRRIVGGIAQEIDAQEEVMRKERELEEARAKQTALRKEKYKERQSDDEYYGYGTTSRNTTLQTTTETKITESSYMTGYTSQ